MRTTIRLLLVVASAVWIGGCPGGEALATRPESRSATGLTDGRDQGMSGAVSLKELRRQPIAYELDIPYANTDNPRQRLDLYLPKDRKSDKLPVIVYFHGGGWLQGNKADGAGRLRPFVRTGKYAGVSVGYRLSGEAIWPAQLHDCKAAIRWVRAHADQYGLDPDRIAVWGRSAGAHLALMIGVTGDGPQWQGVPGPPPDGMGSKVACVANYFGVTDIPALVGQPSDIDRTTPAAPEAQLLGGPLLDHPAKARAASPITYVTANDPPVLTVHGDADRAVPYDQAVRLDAALRKAGVPSYFITVKGAGHGDFPKGMNERLQAFFGRYLLGQKVDLSTEPIKKPGH
jgi:acetyl esterase/lipase